MRRKEPLVTGHIYHIFNRSIAKYTIFNNDFEYMRMIRAFRYYRSGGALPSLSRHILSTKNKSTSAEEDGEYETEIIAYCLMPTHYHLILRQLREGGISTLVANIQNSYARYFNTKYNRRGPLWEGKFKNVLVTTDRQLVHLTRYIHLNPSTANLVLDPEDWPFSSLKEYTSNEDSLAGFICTFRSVLDIIPDTYRAFVRDQISYQKELSLIKHLTLE